MNLRDDFSDLGIGIGLRPMHYAHILEKRPEVGWFEVLTENYLETQGRPLQTLDRIAERYPIALHGVSMSLGSTDPLDWDYLRKLRTLCERTRPRWVSDHVCWTGVMGKNTHDLMPMPLTEEALEHMIGRVAAVQDFLGRALVLENPSTYLEFAGATLSEWQFLRELAGATGARLLLDVNNVYVSSKNHGFDPSEYLAGLPMERVVQLHVAGHTDYGTHLVDTHTGPVPLRVWKLLREAYALGARGSILLEWDDEIPPFEVVHAEARRARDHWGWLDAGAA